MKKEAENERVILSGQSNGVKRHNRRAKALLVRTGTPRPARSSGPRVGRPV